MLLGFLRYGRGMVRFQIEGGFSERFLNLLNQKEFHVWDISRQEYRLTAYTTPAIYRKIRPFARRMGVRIRVIEKRGIPFISQRYRKRAGLAVGAVLFLGLIVTMSQFLWKVEVVGNQEIPTQEILDSLSSLKIEKGAFIPSIDTEYAEAQMRLKLNKLSWIALNVKGSTLVVEIHERVMPPVQIDRKDPCHVVAAKTGTIKYMEVYDGQSMVKVGDTVAKGDLLVSGLMESYQITLLSHARAKVIAEVQEEIQVKVPLKQEYQKETGKKSVGRWLRVLGKTIPLGKAPSLEGEYIVERKIEAPALFGWSLPVDLITETHTGIERELYTLSEEEAMEQARQELRQKERELFGENEFTSIGLKGTVEEGILLLTGTYRCRQDIASSKEILINN